MESTRDKGKVSYEDSCDEDEEEIKQQMQKSEAKTFDSISKHSKYISIVDETIARIKPSVQDRLKYSTDARHIRCLLGPSQFLKLKRREKNCDSGRDDESGHEDSWKRTKAMRMKEKYNKGELWPPKSMQKEGCQGEYRKNRKLALESKDSICSFDSDINLSGLALTKEEKKKIEKNRRSQLNRRTGTTKEVEAKQQGYEENNEKSESPDNEEVTTKES